MTVEPVEMESPAAACAGIPASASLLLLMSLIVERNGRGRVYEQARASESKPPLAFPQVEAV